MSYPIKNVQVQFDCKVGVYVNIETGEIESVHIWDETVDFSTPIEAFHDEYVRGEDLLPEDKIDSPYNHGKHFFEKLPFDHPAVIAARVVIDDPSSDNWPAWDFG